MKRSRILFVGATGLLAALPLLASEGGESEGVFAGDVGNVVWTLLIFGLVVFVLGRYAWGPVLSGLQSRERFIRDTLEAAQKERLESEARLRQYTEQLNTARSEATAIVDEARRDADVVKRRIEAEAQAEAERIVARAKREIELAKEGAVKDLYTVAARLTAELAGKILEREINPADHERLIRDAIRRLDEGN